MKKSEDTKKRILVAAEEEFAQKGFYGARVDEIAECAEVNKRMLYAYFGNKEELYKTVLLNVYNSLSLAEDSLIENDKNTDAATAVQNVIGLYFDFLKNNDNFVRMLMWVSKPVVRSFLTEPLRKPDVWLPIIPKIVGMKKLKLTILKRKSAKGR